MVVTTRSFKSTKRQKKTSSSTHQVSGTHDRTTNKELQCTICGEYWKVGRSYTQHFNNCLKKHNSLKTNPPKNNNNTTFDQSITTFTNNNQASLKRTLPIDDIRKEHKTDHVIFLNNEPETFPEISDTIQLGNNAATRVLEEVPNENIVSSYSSSQLYLMRKMDEYYQETNKGSHLIQKTSLCQVHLMQILREMDCPIKAYDGIMKWVQKWSSESGSSSIFDNPDLFTRRNTVIQSLSTRYQLTGLYPREEKLYLYSPSERKNHSLTISVFDFKDQLLSLLRDKELMSTSNLSLDGPEPGINPKFDNNISEINHGEWYQNAIHYYEKKFGHEKNRVICGIILTVDKTHTDSKGKLCLEPVKFSLTLFNTETRRKKKQAWKRLGYINDLDAYRISKLFENEKGNDNETVIAAETNHVLLSRNKKKKRKKTSTKKSMLYHMILEKILSSLKNVQNEGLIWQLKYPDGRFHKVRLVFPICMCVVDMKGGKQLCGMYDSYHNVNRPCISCKTSVEDMSSFKKQCIPVLEQEIREALDSESEEMIKAFSQHDNPHNVFFNLELGGWKYGIWGMCPSEVLHQFYEGVIDYALDEFYDEVLKSSRDRQNLVNGCDTIWKACKNQSDQDFPKGNFILGITKTGRIKGVEKFASLFYLVLFLHTYQGKTKHFEGIEYMVEEKRKIFKEWREVFEDMLYYHDWLMQKTFKKSNLDRVQQKINGLNRTLQKLIKRSEKGVQNIPKFHEFFHITRDIKRFGPPRGFDSCANEGFLGEDKNFSHHTQQRIDTFSAQTSKRNYESDVIDFAFKNIINNLQKNNEENNKRNNRISLRGTMFVKLKRESRHTSVQFFKDKNTNDSISNTEDFGDELKSFFETSIFSLLEEPNETLLSCYCTMVKENISFRGCSRDDSKSLGGWGMFKWFDHRGEYQVPGKIIMFIDFHSANFKSEYTEIYPKNELHVIIQSLQNCPQDNMSSNVHMPICTSCTLVRQYNYYCVSIGTLYNSAFLVPDLGNKDPGKFLYVFPRYYNQDDEYDLGGWSNKL